MNNTPTPRTDAVEAGHRRVTGSREIDVVGADFARQLERELTEANEALQLNTTHVDCLQRELAAAKEQLLLANKDANRLAAAKEVLQ